MAAPDKGSGGDSDKKVNAEILIDDDRTSVDDLNEEEAFQEDIFADEFSEEEFDDPVDSIEDSGDSVDEDLDNVDLAEDGTADGIMDGLDGLVDETAADADTAEEDVAPEETVAEEDTLVESSTEAPSSEEDDLSGLDDIDLDAEPETAEASDEPVVETEAAEASDKLMTETATAEVPNEPAAETETAEVPDEPAAEAEDTGLVGLDDAFEDDDFDDDALDEAFDTEFDDGLLDDESLFSEEDLDDIPLFDDMDYDDLEGDVDRSVEKSKTDVTTGADEEPAAKKEKESAAPGATNAMFKQWVGRACEVAVNSLKKLAPLKARVAEMPRKRKIQVGAGAGALLVILSASMIFGFSGQDDPVKGMPDSGTAQSLADSPVHTDPGMPAPPEPITLAAETPRDEATNTRRPALATEPSPMHGTTLDNYHAAGERHFREGRFPEAIEAFESDISSAYLFLARCYQILGENEEALQHYQRVLWEYPDRSAFVEVYSLAEELYTAGDFWTARKLYYTFISHVDKMPGSVKKMVPHAYYRICKCFEEEALGLYHGNTIEPPKGDTWGRTRPLTMAPGNTEAADISNPAWRFTPPYRIHVETHPVNDYLNRYTVECVGAPAIEVFNRLASEAGLKLVVDADAEARLQAELVSAFMNERPIEEILEYITGQAGMMYSLDDKRIRVLPLENYIQGGWTAMKDEAIKAFRRSLYRFLGHDDAPKVYYEISKLHYLSGDYDAAINPAKTLIVEYPEFSQVPLTLLNISNCYMELGDYNKARQYLSELVNKYTAHPVAQEGYLLLSRCWWKEGNPAAAQLTLRALEDRFPDSHLRHEGKAVLGRILLSLGQYGEVVKLTEPVPFDSVEKDETAISLMLLQTEAYLRSGKPDRAVDCAVNLLERFPDSSREKDAFYLLAESYFDMEEYFLSYSTCKAIRDEYESTLSDPFLYLMASQSLQKLGFEDKALEWLDTGLSLCMEGTLDTYEMYMLLGDLLFDMGKFERAKVVYRKVREHYDFQNEADKKYVNSLIEQKDFQSALTVIKDLVNMAVGDPGYQTDLYSMAGDCYTAMGRTEAAISAYKGILPAGTTGSAANTGTPDTADNQ